MSVENSARTGRSALGTLVWLFPFLWDPRRAALRRRVVFALSGLALAEVVND
ncbi:MAG: hypothetical protein ACT60Q_27990 [Ferrovibrionaceae bacterium]